MGLDRVGTSRIESHSSFVGNRLPFTTNEIPLQENGLKHPNYTTTIVKKNNDWSTLPSKSDSASTFCKVTPAKKIASTKSASFP